MGILNVTPDSFSDGGKFLDPSAAIDHALDLIAEGAEVVDVGGESTRPQATPVTEEEERRRVVPVIERLAATVQVPISVDTMKPQVARAALDAGASIVNDVAANRVDAAMWKIVAEAGAGYVLMHMQGTPQTMQKAPRYHDVVAEVGGFFEERLARMAEAGVDLEQITLDVGIGFGKTVEHNLQLLANLGSFKKLNRPLLAGTSRKSFIAQATENDPAVDRLPGSLASACWTVEQGVNIIRTHDVAATRQAVRLTEAMLARK